MGTCASGIRASWLRPMDSAEGDFGFLGARQCGLGPWWWGISLDQLAALYFVDSVDCSSIATQWGVPETLMLCYPYLMSKFARSWFLRRPPRIATRHYDCDICAVLDETQGFMPSEPTMRDIVELKIKPMTRGTGLGYALKLNCWRPLRAKIMVSHAWEESYVKFILALRCFIYGMTVAPSSGIRNPANRLHLPDEPHRLVFWVCSTAIYQSEDIPELTIQKQLGPNPHSGPFAAVLRQALAMVCCVTEDCNIYTRMWCVFEIFMAKELQVPVFMANGSTGGTQFSDILWDDAFRINMDAFGRQCLEPVNSHSARCGLPSLPVNDDEKMIRRAIEASPGQFAAVDLAVEEARLETLNKFRTTDRIRFGRGEIMDIYDAVMHPVEARLLGLKQKMKETLSHQGDFS